MVVVGVGGRALYNTGQSGEFLAEYPRYFWVSHKYAVLPSLDMGRASSCFAVSRYGAFLLRLALLGCPGQTSQLSLGVHVLC